MTKRKLVLSVDHEIFGNGPLDMRRHIVEPAERMARISEKFGMVLTVFFEFEEYLVFERERKALMATWGYDPAEESRAQPIDQIKRGHDLQLHLHPEWVGSRFDGGRWILRSEQPTVDSLFETQEEVSAYNGERKTVIDSFYEAAGSARRVTA